MSSLLTSYIKDELPRERLYKYGIESLSNEELITIIIGNGIKDYSCKDIANNILIEYKTITNLKNISIASLKNIKGLGKIKSATLIAAIELGKRVYTKNNDLVKLRINETKVVYDNFAKYIIYEKQENFLVIYLDKQNKYISHKILFKGTLDKSIISPREIFKHALLESAAYIIIMHNHPSGEVNPSKSDDITTKGVYEAGLMLDIIMLDHLIVSENGYYSYLEQGRIKIK